MKKIFDKQNINSQFFLFAMPFLYRIPSVNDLDDTLGVMDYKQVEQEEFHVKIASIDYRTHDTTWMKDKELGNTVLVPDIDRTLAHYVFDTQQEAMDFIRDWWKKR